MSLRDEDLKVSYETSDDQYALLEEFYIPALSQASKYYRIAGYFSSSSLVAAAKGIEGLIANGGSMFLLVSPELTKEDYDVISKHGLSENNNIFRDVLSISVPDERLQALAWLLDLGLLKIRIVVRKESGTSSFHQKICILQYK